MNTRKILSDVALSNLYNMTIASRMDQRQSPPEIPGLCPPLDVRILRARLIMEEAIETCDALGVAVLPCDSDDVDILTTDLLTYKEGGAFSLCEAIDGCCDTIYVCVGALCAMGIPDLPHLEEICRTNDAKFPSGVAIPHDSIPGKYGKPKGWKPPDHDGVFIRSADVDMHYEGQRLVEAARHYGDDPTSI